MHQIDPQVALTTDQLATVEHFGFHVTLEFGHVVVVDPMLLRPGTRQVGTINSANEGRLHAPADHLDIMLDLLEDAHDAASIHAPAATITPPGPEPVVTTPLRTTKRALNAAMGRVIKQRTAEVTLAQGAEVIFRAPKAGGVIGALVTQLSSGRRSTKAELYDALAFQFPDRATETGGMRSTISVQLKALRGKGHNVQSEDGHYWIA